MAATMTAAPVRPSGVDGARLTFPRILASEWAKIRTVRSTFWTLVALVVLGVGLTALLCWGIAGELASGEADGESPSMFITFGLTFGQIAALVLGVLVLSAEYSTGMIRTSLTAVPRRLQLLAAKAAVLATLLLVLGTAVAFGSYFAGNAFLEAEGVGVGLGDEGVLRSLVGNGLYLAVLGLFGLALAVILRHTAGAITVGLALIFVLGNLVMLIPGTFGEWVTKLMPGNAGGSITVPGQWDPGQLGPWTGFGVFALETLVLLAVGAVLFARRDA
jgi:ABC-2 type transport system permease protein